MKVVLIGYRATGKSTVGRILADKLKINFWDTDAMVEKNMEMPIKEIVALHGWDYFRAKEKEIIVYTLFIAYFYAALKQTGNGKAHGPSGGRYRSQFLPDSILDPEL